MKPARLPFREGKHRLSVAHLLVALVAMFVLMPFLERWRYGELVEAIVFTLVLLAGVNAVGGRRRTQIGAVVLVVPALVARWLNHLWPGWLPIEVSLLADVVFVAFVIVHLFRFVMSSSVVNSEVLCAALSIYLLFAVAWAFVYTLLARVEPNAFVFTVPNEAGGQMTGFTALYFSVEILTTIAIGDYMPISNVARMLALVEATVGTFYVAILIARLVGLYSSAAPMQGGSGRVPKSNTPDEEN